MHELAMWSRILLLAVFIVGVIRAIISQVKFRKFLKLLTSQSSGFSPNTNGAAFPKPGIELKVKSFLLKRHYEGLTDPLLREQGRVLRRRYLIDLCLGLSVLILMGVNFAWTAYGY